METFWYRLTQIHLEEWPLKRRESVCILLFVSLFLTDKVDSVMVLLHIRHIF